MDFHNYHFGSTHSNESDPVDNRNRTMWAWPQRQAHPFPYTMAPGHSLVMFSSVVKQWVTFLASVVVSSRRCPEVLFGNVVS